MLPDPERKSAKCADGHQEADEITEPPPYLQHREGDVAEDGIQPRDDGRHGRSPGTATIAQRCRTRMPRTRLPAAALLRTPRKSPRVMPDPTSVHGIVPYQATAPIEGVGHTPMAPRSEMAVKTDFEGTAASGAQSGHRMLNSAMVPIAAQKSKNARATNSRPNDKATLQSMPR